MVVGARLTVAVLDRNLLVNALHHLPLLKELHLNGIVVDLVLPSEPNLTITHFSWECSSSFASQNYYVLRTWFEMFPHLVHLSLAAAAINVPPFTIDINDIRHESAGRLRVLRLAAETGPNFTEMLNKFPNLEELSLQHDTVLPVAKNAPLGDFRKIKKLTTKLTAIINNPSDRLWLQESILQSCRSVNRRDLVFQYAEYGYIEGDADIANFLAAVSEVSKSICFTVYSLFKPKWLERLSTNVEELILNFYELDDGINERHWSKYVTRLRNRGVEVLGNYKGIDGLKYVPLHGELDELVWGE